MINDMYPLYQYLCIYIYIYTGRYFTNSSSGASLHQCSEAPGVGRSTLPKPEPLQHQAHEWNEWNEWNGMELPFTQLDMKSIFFIQKGFCF